MPNRRKARETLVGRFDEVCAREAERVALVEAGTPSTFADVRARAGRLSAHLAAIGVAPGGVVSWQLPNWREAVVVHHAALRAGAIPNPLNPAFRARELRFVLREARPHVLVVPELWRGFDHAALALALRDEGLVEQVVVARGEAAGAHALDDLLDRPTGPPEPARASPEDVALLLYTSGTTGDPKGVQHTHATLLHEIDSFVGIHALSRDDRYLGGAPVTHIAGLVYGILAPFALGTSTVLLDRWEPAGALEAIARDHATFMTGPPTFLQTLAHAHDGLADLSPFRLFSTGGAGIPTEAVRAAGARLGCLVKRAYGSTEVPTLTATTPDDDENARLETDGRPIGGARMRIVRADGTDAPPGEEGEIWARAPEMFVGYRDPALDRDAFADGGWFRTGDLGRVDARGLLRVTGRLKDVIVRGGENISAQEVEGLLSEHPSVAEVAVVGLPHPVLGERACAFVVARGALALEDLTAFLAAREVAKHKWPERLEIRDALPRTESGKVRKDDLRASVAPAPDPS